MNGSTPIARRRTLVTSFTSNGEVGAKANVSNGGIANSYPAPAKPHGKQEADDGGQGKTRRKRSNSFCYFLRRISRRLRFFDILIILAAVAKLASFLYHRKYMQMNMTHHTTSTIENLHKQFHSTTLPSNQNINNSWIKKWSENKMPFNTPVLYRQNGHGHTDKYRGMFRSKHVSEDNEHLDVNGYAVVDDLIYHAEERRELTDWALHESDCISQLFEHHESEDMDVSEMASSVGFSDDDNLYEQQLYIDDGGAWDAYYAFDDDHLRSSKGTGLHEKISSEEVKKQQCMRPTYYSIYHPTCNEIHSTISGDQWMLGDDSLARNWKSASYGVNTPLSKYLGSGYYRNAFLLQRPFVKAKDQHSKSNENLSSSTQWDEVVFKSMKQLSDKASDGGITDDDEVKEDGWGYDPTDKYGYMELMEDMRKDAMVMELLTSSPRAANIYSYCALSSVIEFAPVDIEDYIMPSKGRYPKPIRLLGRRDNHGFTHGPVNDHIEPLEKLEIALEMAKCLAAMHGFVDGPIVHVDVQATQFFRGRDGLIKLVDYNRAEPLLYDIKQDKYCKFVNGPPAEGMFRAPEENIDAPLTEKIDVFSLGNVFYSVLTGIMVHMDRSSEDAHRRIVEGITEPIADFYYESPCTAALAKAIELCWAYDAEERPTIFEIVRFLERAVAANT